MRSAAILCSVQWLLLPNDVSEQPIGLIVKGKEIQGESLLVGFLDP
jgi:hypothetical protein